MELMVEQKYKLTEVGFMPSDWIVSSVGSAFSICNNLRLPLSEIVRKERKGIYPYYGPTKIQDYINEYRAEGEFALIGEDGDHFLKWNTLAMTQLATGKFNVNNHAHLVKGKHNQTTTQWFYYFFKHRDVTNFLTRQGAGRYKLTKATLQQLPCGFPPTLEEQTAIATALSDTDALITGLEKLIAKKRNIKQGALQELLRPRDGWEVKRLHEIVIEARLGGNYQNTTRANDYPLIKMGNIGRGYISIDKLEYIEGSITNEQDKLTYGDLLFNTRNTLELVGKVAIWKAELPTAYYNSNLMRLKFSPRYVASNFLMNAFFNGRRLINQLRDIATGTTSVAAIYTRDLMNVEFKLPPLDAQKSIVDALFAMDSEIDALERKLAKYKEIKQGMMQVLLTGKVRLV